MNGSMTLRDDATLKRFVKTLTAYPYDATSFEVIGQFGTYVRLSREGEMLDSNLKTESEQHICMHNFLVGFMMGAANQAGKKDLAARLAGKVRPMVEAG